jgi:hypothetical protein
MKIRLATALFLFLIFCTVVSLGFPGEPIHQQTPGLSGGGSPFPCNPSPAPGPGGCYSK